MKLQWGKQAAVNEQKERSMSISLKSARNQQVYTVGFFLIYSICLLIFHLSLQSGVGGGGDDAFNTFLGWLGDGSFLRWLCPFVGQLQTLTWIIKSSECRSLVAATHHVAWWTIGDCSRKLALHPHGHPRSDHLKGHQSDTRKRNLWRRIVLWKLVKEKASK